MHEPITYTYEADHHCPDCAEKRFGRDEHGDITGTDNEGNKVGIVMPWDEWFQVDGSCETLACGDCHEALATAHADPHSEECPEHEAPAVHFHAGHNVAGYMPEADVECFATWDEARSFLADELLRAADAVESWADEHDCDDIPCPTYGDECAWMHAQRLRGEAEELKEFEGPEFLTYTNDGGEHTIPTAWWIRPCVEDDCEGADDLEMESI